MARATEVACWMSPDAPLEMSPETISSAMRPGHHDGNQIEHFFAAMIQHVLFGQGHGGAEGLAARDDGHFVQADGCVRGKTLTKAWPASCQAVHFLFSSDMAMLRRSRPMRTLMRASSSSTMPMDFLAHARGQQGGFVQKIGQVGAGIAGRAAGDDVQIDRRVQLHVAGVDFQNGFASAHVRAG